MKFSLKILFLWPKYPDTFWSFKYALPFVGKKAAFPPLGLLTIAALLPKDWDKKLVDLNVEELKDNQLQWADYVFISAMIIQKKSVKKIIKRAKKLGKKIVAGGPLFTTGYEEFSKNVDHFVLGEGEITIPHFLKDLNNGCPKKIYEQTEWADITKSPSPQWNLIDIKKYVTMNIQYSRGCPFNCEFCDIVLLNGRGQRAKNKAQVSRELDALYERGWRGNVFFVDDNFIGNSIRLKNEILPSIIQWMEEKKYPFSFNTQASVNLADDEKLMESMVKAGFDTAFIGIETPDEKSLAECSKFQNTKRNLLDSIQKIQRYGLQIQGGFIVGFDNDTSSIFERQINFIQKSGITAAMVGILGALPKTRLYQRLKKEKRLLKASSGDNTDSSMSFIPKMNKKALISGYQKILKTIYSPKNYYERIETFFKNYRPPKRNGFHFRFSQLEPFLKSIWLLGIREKERFYYWKLFFRTLLRKPNLFPLAIDLAIKGFHFRKISENYLKIKNSP